MELRIREVSPFWNIVKTEISMSTWPATWAPNLRKTSKGWWRTTKLYYDLSWNKSLMGCVLSINLVMHIWTSNLKTFWLAMRVSWSFVISVFQHTPIASFQKWLELQLTWPLKFILQGLSLVMLKSQTFSP